MVKLYCFKCQDVYIFKFFRYYYIDGVYFGIGFFYMLFMVYFEYRFKRLVN